MKIEQLMAIARTVSRSAPVLGFGLLAGAALAYTVHAAQWHQVNARRVGRAPFRLVLTPASQQVAPGGTAQYQISIVRHHHFTAKVKLALFKPSGGLNTHLVRATGDHGGVLRTSLRRKDRYVLLTVGTSTSTPSGNYGVRVRAVGGEYRGVINAALVIAASRPLSISGNFGPLWPGTSRAVDLSVSNPNSSAISVSKLTVGVRSVGAPRATTSHPCSAADFAVAQFSGTYPLVVPANSTVRLSDLGVASAQQPHVTMINRPVNQNGCQGATVTLSYSGSATG